VIHDTPSERFVCTVSRFNVLIVASRTIASALGHGGLPGVV
jgi:hypothetical protein